MSVRLRRILPLALPLVLLASPGGAAPPAVERGQAERLGIDGRQAPAVSSDEHVLMRRGTPLHTTPRPQPALGGSEGPCCTGAMAPAYWAMRAVAAHGEMVEVETLGPEPDWEAHCVGTPHGNLGTQALGKYRLRLFVRRDDLLPVTRREVAVVSADGTSLRLRPGVRVTRSKDARGGAVFAGEEGAPDSLARDEDEDAGVLRFTAPLPEDAVGLSYWPAPWTERVDDTALFPRARADGPGHELVGREPLTLGSGATVVPPSSTWWARLGRRQAGGRLVELTSGCAQVRAVVPTRRLRQVPENLGGVVGGLLCGDYFDDSWTVRAGAPVYSGHGQRIGEVLVEDTLRGPARSSPHGHRCFTVFPDGSRPTLTLCFAPDDVQQMEQEPGESAEDERP